MVTIESDIIEWALTRPAWQQDLLVALAEDESYDSDRVALLVDKILAGTSDAPNQEAKRIQVKSAIVEQVKLLALADLEGVNALVPGQRLDFGFTGLTVIYGDNGSGKSGYARLVKSLVSARHRADILPNVFAATTQTPTGVVHYDVASAGRQFAFPGEAPPDLLKMSFYDEYCGDAYLTKESTISYRPSALTLLDGLIRVCDAVRAEIASRVASSQATALALDIPLTTTAGAFLATLSRDTTDAQVDVATALPDGTNERLAGVLQEEARLKGSDPLKEKVRLSALSTQVGNLGHALAALLESVGPLRVIECFALRSAALAARGAASIAAAASFDDEPLPGVGSETWRALWKAARDYSVTEAFHDHEFPVVDDEAVCVLCQQELGDDAQRRLHRFDDFMADTTERDATAAERTYTTTLEVLRGLAFATPARATALSSLEGLDDELGAATTTLLAHAEAQRVAILAQLTGDGAAPDPLPATEIPVRILALSSQLGERAASTDGTQFQDELTAFNSAKVELQASVRLSDAADKVKLEVRRLGALNRLAKARSAADTNSITLKASALTRAYSTERILDQFTRETERLRLQNVTLQDLGGHKGVLNQKPGLLGAAKKVLARNVLSEGEQTALGLAGFFTEAVFDESKSAIVFDDPVTSLDHLRRDKVAERLAQLAKDRQVVVFTHDVAFTGNLVAAAEREGVMLTERSVTRRGAEPGVCITAFPWKAKDFPARVAHLTAELGKLKKDRPDLQQDDWEARVATWAGDLSETWERSVTTEVLNQVFDRGTSQVRMLKFRALAQITEDDNQDLQDGYGFTSLCARRHDKSVETSYVAPEIEDLERELARLTAWQKRVKSYLKS